MAQQKPYNDFTSYMKRLFGLQKVQKISIDAGFDCPNRDGTLGRGGCTYCLNPSFNPNFAARKKSITKQLDEGIAFFRGKYPGMQYLAYFQSFSNTYAPLHILRARYEEALAHPQVIGLVIGTRPDCVDTRVLDYLAQLNQQYHVVLEMGIESTRNSTLEAIQRGHNFEQTRQAFFMAQARGLNTGGHLILGLPGESTQDMLEHARRVSQMPIQQLKLHQLQVLAHTPLGRNYPKEKQPMSFATKEEYLQLVVAFLERLHPNIVIERFLSQAPRDLIIYPKNWQVKNFQFADMVSQYMSKHHSWQGKHWHANDIR